MTAVTAIITDGRSSSPCLPSAGLLHSPREMGSIVPTLSMRKLRLREVEGLGRDHTAEDQQGRTATGLGVSGVETGTEGCVGHSGSHLVGDFARIVLDGELRQRHLGLGVEWVGAVVVMALLQKRVVCGLGAARGQRVGRAQASSSLPGGKFSSPDWSPSSRREEEQVPAPLAARCLVWVA